MYDFREYSELYHYGILGMRWGVRRFQNEDGTLTSKGIERYTDKVVGRDSSNDKVLTKKDVEEVGNWDRYLEDERYGYNCPNCTLALELKKRGINDLIPLPTGGMTDAEIRYLYKGESVKKYKNRNELFDTSKYGPPGSHGAIQGWYPNNAGGHILNYTVLEDGTIQIEDAQIGAVYTLDDARTNDNLSVYYFQSGMILNLTDAEIDINYAKSRDMIAADTKEAEEKVAKYEKSVRAKVGLSNIGEFAKNTFKKGAVLALLDRLKLNIRHG